MIKILSYLEREKRAKVRNWNDTDMWNIGFHKLPLTLASLTGQEQNESNDKRERSDELKLYLIFSPQTGILALSDNEREYEIRIQGQVQREVLRVIFENPRNTYTEWSLYDVSERLGREDVNEVAVKNAIYQFNKKVQLKIPEIKNLFVLTKHSAKLNSKYTRKK